VRTRRETDMTIESKTATGSAGSAFGGTLSLRAKLIIGFAAMAIVPILLVAILTSQTVEQALMQSVFEKNRLLAQNIAGDVDQMITEKIRMLRVAAANTDIQSMDGIRQTPALRTLTAHYPDLLVALTTTPEGDLVASSRGESARINNRDRDYFQEAMKTGATAISDVLISRLTGKPGIAIAEPIRRGDQTIGGMLIVTLDLQKLINRIAETRIGSTGYTYVVNKQGRVLMHPDRELVEKAEDFSRLAPVQAALRGETGWAEYAFRGQKKLAGYSSVPVTGWGLVAQLPLDEAMADVTAIKKAAGIIILSVVVIVVLVQFRLAGMLYKPIAELTVAAGKVADGDLTVKAAVVSHDEIGSLAESFNRMTERLRQIIEGLRVAKEGAEAADRAKSAFLSSVTDKLRTPLNAILGYSELMQRDGSLGAEQREYLDTIKGSGEHLLGLIDEVLQISKDGAQGVTEGPAAFDPAAPAADLHANEAISPQQLQSALSPQLLGELHDAVLTLDTEQTMTVIEKISLHEPSMGATLKKIALNLDYDCILGLLEKNGPVVHPERRSIDES